MLTRRSLVLVLACVLLGLLPAPAHGNTALSPVTCVAMSRQLYSATNPSSGQMLLTTSLDEATKATTTYGFTEGPDAFVTVATESYPGLVAVHRLYRNGDFVWAHGEDVNRWVARGYVDHGVNFQAASSDGGCTRPVYQVSRAGHHAYTTDADRVSAYVEAGWTRDGTAFHAAKLPARYPAPTTAPDVALVDPNVKDTVFSFAVIPDTQMEVHRDSDPRLAHRMSWILSRRATWDTRFTVQVGDFVDWDTPDHDQYVRAQRAAGVLEQGGMPYFLNIGNHDTAAVCPGGGACDMRWTDRLVRWTSTMNDYFSTSRYGTQTGAFEPGKIDNTWSTMGAGGRTWLVLNLELWPRTSVIAWANDVVRAHPHHNVIITTHSYLSSSGTLSNSDNYGDTTPRYLWDNLIKRHKNIKIVLSGHAGSARTRIDRGVNGNKIYTFLTCYHSSTTNPTRMVRINISKNTIETWVDAPDTNRRLVSVQRYTSAGFVR